MLLYSQASHNPQIIHLPLSVVQKFRALGREPPGDLGSYTQPHPADGIGDLRSQCDLDGTLGSVVLMGMGGGTSICSTTTRGGSWKHVQG